MSKTKYTIEPIGFVRSTLTQLEDAPMQGDEGAPDAWLELKPSVAKGITSIKTGDELIVLTWLHLANSALPKDQQDYVCARGTTA